MPKKVLVTGGCGWLGAAIVRALLARGDSVIAADVVVAPQLAAVAAQNPRLAVEASDLGEWSQVVALFRGKSAQIQGTVIPEEHHHGGQP